MFTFGLCNCCIAQEAQEDTLFIKNTATHKIFSIHNNKSPYYESIADFWFDTNDAVAYRHSIDFLLQNSEALKKQKPVLPILQWLPLQQYNNALYLYHPCDFYTHYIMSINDTTYIDWTGEGPVANKIISQKKINRTKFLIQTTGIYDTTKTIEISVIDSVKQIAVFKETTTVGITYRLMIANFQKHQMPIIINHCPNAKEMELQFEKIDFEKLLSTGKN